MAVQEQIEILKQGAKAWNEWRENHPTELIDLRGARLGGFNLKGTRLCNADLTNADLSCADLSDSDLRATSIIKANLTAANLAGADLGAANFRSSTLDSVRLYKASLSETNLRWVRLSRADMRRTSLDCTLLEGAYLNNADLTEAQILRTSFNDTDLQNADFSNAKFYEVAFSHCDLRTIKGLETVVHLGPSYLSVDTLLISRVLPESFLRGCGLPDKLITYLPSLLSDAIQFYSCFISHSSNDHEFAIRLHADLQSKGVRCWFAPEDLKIGDKFRTRIDESIRLHDKLLLVLSEHSVSSDWVEKEVETAMEQERQEKRTVLFPIRLDDAVINIPNGWPADIRRTRHIGDFRKWKNHDDYQKAFDRLLRDLKTSTYGKS